MKLILSKCQGASGMCNERQYKSKCHKKQALNTAKYHFTKPAVFLVGCAKAGTRKKEGK